MSIPPLALLHVRKIFPRGVEYLQPPVMSSLLLVAVWWSISIASSKKTYRSWGYEEHAENIRWLKFIIAQDNASRSRTLIYFLQCWLVSNLGHPSLKVHFDLQNSCPVSHLVNRTCTTRRYTHCIFTNIADPGLRLWFEPRKLILTSRSAHWTVLFILTTPWTLAR